MALLRVVICVRLSLDICQPTEEGVRGVGKRVFVWLGREGKGEYLLLLSGLVFRADLISLCLLVGMMGHC